MKIKSSVLISSMTLFLLLFGAVGLVLAAPEASVTLSGAGDVFIGASPIPMSVTFDNTAGTGSANIGYGPFIDVYFPVNGADGAAGTDTADGLDYVANSATYLGVSVTEDVRIFPAGPLGGICAANESFVYHPYALDTLHNPIRVCGIPGDKLVVFLLPFGSFTPDQPPATVDFEASLSNFADLSAPVFISARGGYEFGEDPLDNPCCDPSFFTDGSPETITDNPVGAVNPILLTLTKTNTPPEAEVATGPNYPHTYTVTVEAAPGQTITNLDVFDYIDDNIVITNISAPGATYTLGGASPVFPAGPVLADGTANELVVNYASFTGTVSFDIEYYVPLRDASGASIITANNGASSTTDNTAKTVGDWNPLDPRDLGGTDNATAGDSNCPSCPPLVTHENEPMPVQKSLQNLTDGTALDPDGTPSPGDVIEYTLNIQVSDFFALDDVWVFDVISDGQHLTGTPTLSYTQNGTTVGGAITNFEERQYFTGGTPGAASSDPDVSELDGDTVLAIDLSAELALYGFNEVLGGCVPAGGTGVGDPDCNSFNGGATTVTITYQTIIQDAFTDTYPSGDASVDHGDTLDNVVTLRVDTVLDTTDLSPTGIASQVVDDTGTSLTIAQGLTSKSIYAITDLDTNTTILYPSGVPQVSPGDVVTFRLRYEMPATDFEDFSMSDYLPLPVLDANEVTIFNDVISDDSDVFGLGIPAAGEAMWGPTGRNGDPNINFADIAGSLQNGFNVPTITTPGSSMPAICGSTAISSAENFVNFCFGDYDDPANEDSYIDILFSVTVSDDPFADELFLTNFVRGGTGSTNALDASSDEIVMFELRQPILMVRKGISDSTNPGESFSESPNPSLAPAGDASVPPFTGSMESSANGGNGEANNGTNADVDGLDAGDTVRYVITIQNTGGAAAFDIELFDSLPTGLTCNSATVNLNVTLGDGSAVAYNNLGTNDPCDFFTNFDGNAVDGIELVDPTEGLCQTADVDPALAVIVITYDLTIDSTVSAGDLLINTTTVTNYANSEGGTSHLTDVANRPFDTAQIEIAGTIEKDLISTSEVDSSDTEVGIVGDERPVMVGEVVTYRVYTRVPEGTTPSLQFRDNTPNGLQYVAGSARYVFLSTSGTALSSTTLGATGFGMASPDPTALTTGDFTTLPIAAVSGGASSGDDLLVSFGDVNNSANNDEAEYVVLEFDMVVNNIASNQDGSFLLNTATLIKNGTDLVTSDEDTSDADNDEVALVVIEPVTTIDKSLDTVNSIPSGTTSFDAGDTVVYTIVVQNTGNANSYDLVVTDGVDANLNLTSVTILSAPGYVTSNTTGSTLGAAGNALVTISELHPTDTVVIQVTTQVLSSVTVGEIIANTSDASWTSLPGTNGTGSATPGIAGTDTGERIGTTGVNDYTVSDTENITINSHNATKSITATSETSTDNSSLPNSGASNVPVTIGEVLRYQLVVDVPEGTSPDLIISDLLSSRIALIEDAEIQITTLNFGSGNFDSIDFGAGLEAANGGTVDLHNGTTYTFTAPFNLVDYNTGSNLLTFNLGDIINNDSDANVEQIIITFNVIVLNTTAASNDLGDILANSFEVYSADAAGISQLRDTSNTVNAVIQEPVLTIDKTIDTVNSIPAGTTSFEAGDTVFYTIVVTGGNAANQITAYDLIVTDGVDANLDLVGVDVLSAPGYVVSDTTGSTLGAAGNVLVTISELRPTDTVTIQVETLVRSSVTMGQIIANTSNVSWTSLPNTGTTSNPTGSNTPGGSGADNGERDSSTAPAAPDDYLATDTVNFTVTGTVDTIKSIDGTSEAHTDDTTTDVSGDERPVAVGEVITYRLVVDVPEGTSPDVQVIDTLVPNTQFIAGTAFVSYNADNSFTGTGTYGTNQINPTTTFPAGLISFNAGSRELRFDVGQVINNDGGAADTDAEQLIIEFQVVVVNTSDNIIGQIWRNSFGVDLNNDTTSEDTSNDVYQIVQEPVVTATKAIIGTAPVDALENVTYDIVVTAGNAANQETAYNLNVNDVLHNDLQLISVVIQTQPAGNYVTIDADNSTYTAGASIVDIDLNRLEPGDSVTIRVVAEVQTSVSPGETVDNDAVITWTSLPGPQGTGNVTPGNSGDSDGERNGSGGDNDHTTPTNTVNFTILSPEPVKSIDGTSETGTSDAEDGSAGNERPVAIGEEVTYRLAVVLPESTSISFSLDDVLENGIEYVAGSARVSYLADTVPSFNAAFLSPVPGILNESEPSFTFPASNINFDTGTRTLSFDFGSIINNDGDADREYIIVEFTVVVIDDVVNNAGQLWGNDFDVVVDEGLPTEVITTSNEVGIIVVEPVVNITKTFSPDTQVRGGTTTMTLVVSNFAADGATGAAYDLVVTDFIDDWLNVDETVVPIIDIDTSFAPGATATDNSDISSVFGDALTDDINITIDQLDVDEYVTITIVLQIDPNADTLLLSRTITNTATVVNDSLSTDVTPDDEDREYTDTASDDLNVVKPTLLVTKTDSADPVAAGATMSYTVSIQNTGTPNFAATNVQFRDQIPTGFIVTLVSPSQGSCSPIVGGVLSCSMGTIASGASATVTVTGRYPSTTANGTIGNNISYVTSTEGNHGNDGNDTPADNDDERAEEPTTILRQVDVAITKVVDDSSPNEGDLITFTLNLQNNGPSQATSVIVTDSIPAGLTFVQFVPSTLPCVYAAPTLTCNFPSLNVGAIRTIGIEATVDAGTAGGAAIFNIASVTAAEAETNFGNNSDDAVVTVDSMDLQVVKVVNDATPNEGDTIVYTITVSNLGPAPATGIQITDDLNALNGITYVSDNSATTGTTYSSATGVWTLTGVTLDAGDTISLQITATVDAGASALPQPLVNNASLTASNQPDTNSANNTDNANVAVGGLDLSLIKGVNNPSPNEGDTIVYSLILQNLGAANATNILVYDQLDTIPVSYVSHTISSGGSTYDPVTGQWTIPNLAAGRTVRLDITVTVDAGAAGSTITNIANIVSLDQTDANSANNTDDAVITVGSLDLAVTKSVDNPTPAEGDTIVYSVTIVNNGPATATGVIVADALPAGVTYVSDNSASLLDSTGAATLYDSVTGMWLIGTLDNGDSLTLQITATVAVGTSGTTIDNVASLGAVNQPDTNSANNTDNALIAVAGLDLQVTKTVDNPTANEGDTLVYSITVENLGAADATNITVTDDLNILPLTYVSDNSTTVLDSLGAATSYVPATGAWTIGQLNAGQSLTLQITVTVNTGTSGTSITNTATLTAVDQADSNPSNNDDDAVVTVGAVDIQVLKVVDNPAPLQGDNVTYTITVTNLGVGVATGVIISEDLPLDGVNLTYVSDNPSQGTFTPGTPGSWNIGNLASGQSVTLQLTVTVEIDDGQILNVASLSAVDQIDSNSANNSDDATITLNGIDLAVVKTVDNPTPETGDTVTYSIMATNNGPSTATGVNVLDILPAGVAYISDNAALLLDDTGVATVFDSTTGNWAVGQLNAGSSLTLTIQVTVLVNGGVVVNTAEITGNEPESDSSNNIDDASISIDSADLSVTKGISTTTPQVGDFITYTVTVSNAGPNIAYNVELTDTMPTTVAYSGTYTASQGTFNGTVWTVGTLPVGSAASLQITVQVISNTGTFVNVAEVTASDQTDIDSTPNNGNPAEDDYAESSFAFDPPFGRKVFDASGLPQLDWTVTWVNPNTNPLAVSVNDPIPAGTSFVSGSLTCTSPGTVVVNTCVFDPVTNSIVFDGTLFPNPGATPATINSATNRLIINYRVTVNSAVSQVRNEAFLNSVNGDNVAVAALWTRGAAASSGGTGAAITLTKYVEPAIAFPGQTLTWILEVSNPSGAAATGVVVTDSIPLGLNIQSTQPDAGTVSVSGQDVTWNVGTVAAGQTLRLRIVTQVSTSLTAPVTNTALVVGDNFPSMEASATAAFVEGLPNTGETAWWTWLLWAGLILMPLSLAGLWWLRQRRA